MFCVEIIGDVIDVVLCDMDIYLLIMGLVYGRGVRLLVRRICVWNGEGMYNFCFV